MASSIYLYAFLTWLALIQPNIAAHLGQAFFEEKVAIGVNTYINETDRKMPLGASSFLELISKGVFIDKTLLIHSMLTKIFSRTIITCPNRWGKTINLDMLKTFIQMQVHPNGTRILPISSTKNYQLFIEGQYYSDEYNIKLETPLLIAEKQCIPTVNEYLGQYPVIHLSFADVEATHEKIFSIAKLSKIISKAFEEHKYMIELYDASIQDTTYNNTYEKKRAADNKKKFLSYFKGAQKNLETSIEFLGKELYDQYEKPVFIFIDEYDRILDIEKRDKKIDVFFANTLKYNQHLKRAILTGTLPKELDADDVTLNEFLDTPYHHYYGFNTDEMNLLYHHYQIPMQARKKIEYWYGGYEAIRNVKEKLFYPWSICNYINNRQLVPYIQPHFEDPHINDTFNLPLFQYTFGRLITGKDYDIGYLLFADQEWDTFEAVKNIKPGILHLHDTGYLITMNSYFQPTSDIKRYRIPNYETSISLQTMFASKLNLFYQDHILGVLQKTSTYWEQFLLKSELSLREFHEQMQKCYKVLVIYNDLPMRDVIVMIQTVVVSIMPSEQFHFISWQFETTTRKKTDELTIPPDVIVLSSESRGIIIDIMHYENASLSSVADQKTPRYLDMFREYPSLHDWKDIKFVFFNTKPNETIEIYSSLHQL